MPNRTTFLLFLLISGLATDLTAQAAKYRNYRGIVNGVHTYDTAVLFPNDRVADDYGPRTGDPWHSGIDYNAPGGDDQNDLGDLILAIEGGKVSSTSNVNTGSLKWITIEGTHNIAYEHIGECGDISGDGEYTGGCLIKNLDEKPKNLRDNWAIIFQINGNYHAIGPVDSSKVTFKDEAGVSRTLTVSNTVAQGAPVAPLGNSCDPKEPYEPHAHIQGMSQLNIGDEPIKVGLAEGDKYSKNILEYVPHDSLHDSLRYILTVKQQSHPSGISPVYPGDERTPLKAHVVLSGETGKRYNKGIMDVEAVEFKIKNHLFSDWKNIKGPNFDRFQFGGRMDKGVVPKNFRQSTIGSWGVSGMDPHAYLKDPYDDFYFNEFYARIHKSDPTNGTLKAALYPWDSRYMDGNYTLKAAMTNVHNEFPDNWSGGYDFIIDNFKPFIHGVRVEIDDLIPTPFSRDTVYARFWEAQNTTASKIKLGARMQKSLKGGVYNKQIIVYALSSESMSNVQASIPDLQTNWINGVALDVERKKWLFTFSPHNLSDNCYEIEFTGRDLNNNQLLDLPAPLFCAGGDWLNAIVPKRTGASTWDNAHPQGTDEVHRFYIGPCEERPEAVSESPCPEREMIQYTVLHARNAWSGTGKITLNISVDYSNWVFTWKNELGNVISNSPNVTGLLPGVYCLEITNGCCSYNDCIEIADCNYSIDEPIVNCANGCIDINITGNFPPYEVTWEIPNNSPVTRSGLSGNNGWEDLCYLHENGAYTVTVNNELCGVLNEYAWVDCGNCDFVIMAEKVRDAICGNNGYIKVSTSPFQSGARFDWYKWDYAIKEWRLYIPNSGREISGIGSGKYKVVVRSGDCFISKEFTIISRDDLHGNIEIVNPVSYCTPQPAYWPYYSSSNDGILCVDYAPNNLSNFQVVWSNGDTGFCNYDLAPGAYSATLVFDDGCEFPIEPVDLCCCEKSGELPAHPGTPFCVDGGSYPGFINITGADITGSSDNDGSISINVSPSSGATYRYSWSPYGTGTSHTVTNLAPGTYCVTVSHICGGEIYDSECFEVQGCNAVIDWTVGMKTNNIRPCAVGQGAVGDLLLINEGNQMAPFTYQWTGPGGMTSTERDLFNLLPGLYTVTVTDKCGRTITATHELDCCTNSNYVSSAYNCFRVQTLFGWQEKDGDLNFHNSNDIYGGNVHPCDEEITLYWYDGSENTITWNDAASRYDGVTTKHPPAGQPGQYCVSWTNKCGCSGYGCQYFGGEGIVSGFRQIELEYFMDNNNLNGFSWGDGADGISYNFNVIYQCGRCNACGGGYDDVLMHDFECSENDHRDYLQLHDTEPYDDSPCSGEAAITCINNPSDPLDPWLIPSGIEGIELIDYNTIEYKYKPDGTPICVHPVWCLFTGSQIDNFPRSEPVLVQHPVGKIIDEGTSCLPLEPPVSSSCPGGVILPDPNGVNERCELKWYCSTTNQVVETEVLDEFIITCRCIRSTVLGVDNYCNVVNKCITFNPVNEDQYPPYLCGGFEVLPEETANCATMTNIPDCFPQARPGSSGQGNGKEVTVSAINIPKRENKAFRYTVFPNPFLNSLTIQFEHAENTSFGPTDIIQLSVYDVAGRLIGQQEMQVHGETLSWDLQSLGLSKGVYTFMAKSNIEHMNFRFILAKME
ncbi:MAG: T9SS type A sorting domain-containing protein [Saprospiraceae bacterium]|nr:T9SS type A sorting domain-containing protein [Saprospiraceae bacterium]